MSDGFGLATGLNSAGTLIKEYILDHSPMRFVLIVFMIPIFCIATFACLCVIGSIVSD